MATLDLLLRESGRPVTFIALFDRDDIPEAVRNTLKLAAPQIAMGARPQTSPLPLTREINMRSPFSFAAFPSWKRVFADKSDEALNRVYADTFSASPPVRSTVCSSLALPGAEVEIEVVAYAPV